MTGETTGYVELSSALLGVGLIYVLQIPPVIKILHRAGQSGWWAVLVPISPLNFNVPVAVAPRTMVPSSVLLIYLLIGLALISPVVKILHRAGYSGWWVVLVPIPLLNVIGLWFLAYCRWSIVDRPISN
jgi:uncharacterized membrane protein YhaH (DUF805 family)